MKHYLVIGFLLAATALPAQQMEEAQAPPHRPEGRVAPYVPGKPEDMFKRLFRGAPENALDESPVLRETCERIGNIYVTQEGIVEMTEKQERILSGREPATMPRGRHAQEGRSREAIRKKVMILHEIQKRIDAKSEKVRDMSASLVDYLVEHQAALEQLYGQWQEAAGDNQNARHLENLAHVLQVAQTPGDEREALVEKLPEEIRERVRNRSEAQRGFLYQRFSGRLEGLEREQALLFHQLQENRRELQEIREQLEKMGNMRDTFMRRRQMMRTEDKERPWGGNRKTQDETEPQEGPKR